jgi:hypothetical protein
MFVRDIESGASDAICRMPRPDGPARDTKVERHLGELLTRSLFRHMLRASRSSRNNWHDRADGQLEQA